MKKHAVFTSALATAVLLVSSSALAIVGIPSAPTSDGGVTPYIIPGANPGGNRTCAEVGVAYFGNATYYQCWSDDRDPGDFGQGFGDISGNALCDSNVIVASNDGTYVAFTAGPDGVGAAILKGGSGGGNVYVYEPQSLGDSGLAAPLNPGGDPAELSHSDGFCWNPVDDEGEGFGCYVNETAWSAGERYVRKGNWATYTAYAGQLKEVVLFAGQTMDAGTVTFSAPVDDVVTITIELNDGWRFALEPVGEDDYGYPIFDNNIKVQDYSDKPPAINPAPGLFMWKTFADGQSGEIDVPAANYYGVHVDVEREVDCPE